MAALIKAGEWAQGALSGSCCATYGILSEWSTPTSGSVQWMFEIWALVCWGTCRTRTAVMWITPNDCTRGGGLTASALGEIPRDKLVGIVSMRGSANSHTAILARAMGIPAVVGVEDLPLKQLPDQRLVVDGYNGRVYVNRTLTC